MSLKVIYNRVKDTKYFVSCCFEKELTFTRFYLSKTSPFASILKGSIIHVRVLQKMSPTDEMKSPNARSCLIDAIGHNRSYYQSIRILCFGDVKCLNDVTHILLNYGHSELMLCLFSKKEISHSVVAMHQQLLYSLDCYTNYAFGISLNDDNEFCYLNNPINNYERFPFLLDYK
jgi:hypothetical protein